MPGATQPGGPAFDLAKFQSVTGKPPAALRVRAEAPMPGGLGAMKMEIAAKTTTPQSVRMLTDIAVGGQAVKLEILSIGNKSWLRGEAPGQKVDWIASTQPAGQASEYPDLVGFNPLELGGAGGMDKPFTSEGVADCLGRKCFVLSNPSEPGSNLYVDTQSYLPVLVVAPQAPGQPPFVATIEWNVDVRIDPPSGAKEVSSEEFGASMLGLMMGIMAGALGGALTPTPAR